MSAAHESPAAEHDRLRTDLAGYVLGGLTPAEQLAVEAHLAECKSCRTELVQLDPVPVLLEIALDAETVSALPDAEPEPERAAVAVAPRPMPIPPPPLATPSTPPAPTRRHRPRRVRASRRVFAGAAAVMLVVAAFAVGYLVAPRGDTFGPAYQLHAVGGSNATGTAAMRLETYGTEVHLDLKGLAAGHGTYYECLWWSSSGVRTAGTFKADTDDHTVVDLVTVPDHRGDWTLQIVKHQAGAKTGLPVLQSST